jgi:hypothetical protein
MDDFPRRGRPTARHLDKREWVGHRGSERKGTTKFGDFLVVA